MTQPDIRQAGGAARLPTPEESPTVDLWPTAGKALGLGRGATYAAARRGDIPTIRVSRLIRVPTAPLRRMLGIDETAA